MHNISGRFSLSELQRKLHLSPPSPSNNSSNVWCQVQHASVWADMVSGAACLMSCQAWRTFCKRVSKCLQVNLLTDAGSLRAREAGWTYRIQQDVHVCKIMTQTVFIQRKHSFQRSTTSILVTEDQWLEFTEENSKGWWECQSIHPSSINPLIIWRFTGWLQTLIKIKIILLWDADWYNKFTTPGAINRFEEYRGQLLVPLVHFYHVLSTCRAPWRTRHHVLSTRDIQESIWVEFFFQTWKKPEVTGVWSRSRLTLSERQVTPWAGRQFITRPDGNVFGGGAQWQVSGSSLYFPTLINMNVRTRCFTQKYKLESYGNTRG